MKIILLPAVLLLAVMRLPAQIDLQLDLVSDAFGAVVDISHAGDDRLFIVEQVGRIQLLQADGNVNQTPFLDIINKVGSGGERGLLGLTFHPMYAENGYFFVNYTDKDGNTVVSRYKVSAGDPDLADPASETVLLTLDQPEGNHNGGELNFGPDGYLYIATGDGGGAGDTRDYAQNTTVPFGKLLRIDIDNGTGTGPDYSFGSGYTIPASNPLVDGTGGTLDEIWAVGLRNPWRFSFDRLTGDLWIGDVGQADWEEIDLEPAGSTGGNNYGWRCYEGNESYNSTGCSPASAYTFPVYEYGHDVGCSINGGYVYRGTDYPLLYGLYLYSDYCSGRIWSLESVDGSWVNEELLQVTGAGFVTMGEDYQGELYLGSQDGAVYRLMDATCINDLPDLLLDESPIPTDTYFAGDLLTASATIEAETSVIFLAAGVISLQPGFRAQAGSSLQARN
ncbi:MAG: PQQ-dependent sugar dehydrogenase, partial [Lewinella sp.]|nr:PQQ-dependent sugar dehydrogenase [Lewinella sp.]